MSSTLATTDYVTIYSTCNAACIQASVPHSKLSEVCLANLYSDQVTAERVTLWLAGPEKTTPPIFLKSIDVQGQGMVGNDPVWQQVQPKQWVN